MDFVYKKKRPLPHLSPLFRHLHDFFDLLDPACDRTEIYELRFCFSCDDACKRRFSHARRAPENHGGNLIPFYELSEDLPFSNKMFLSHKIFQSCRPESGCQRDSLSSVIKQCHLFHIITLLSDRIMRRGPAYFYTSSYFPYIVGK